MDSTYRLVRRNE